MIAASFDVDVASTTICVAESSLLPTVTVQGSASRSGSRSDARHYGTDQASIVGQLNAADL